MDNLIEILNIGYKLCFILSAILLVLAIIYFFKLNVKKEYTELHNFSKHSEAEDTAINTGRYLYKTLSQENTFEVKKAKEEDNNERAVFLGEKNINYTEENRLNNTFFNANTGSLNKEIDNEKTVALNIANNVLIASSENNDDITITLNNTYDDITVNLNSIDDNLTTKL